MSKLPRGVFRCILEYKFPVFRWRYSEPYLPIQGKQERHFPAIEKLNYNNYLVAYNELDRFAEFQFILKDGANCGTKGRNENWKRVEIN